MTSYGVSTASGNSFADNRGRLGYPADRADRLLTVSEDNRTRYSKILLKKITVLKFLCLQEQEQNLYSGIRIFCIGKQ
jgi:hypothetical protein